MLTDTESGEGRRSQQQLPKGMEVRQHVIEIERAQK